MNKEKKIVYENCFRECLENIKIWQNFPKYLVRLLTGNKHNIIPVFIYDCKYCISPLFDDTVSKIVKFFKHQCLK